MELHRYWRWLPRWASHRWTPRYDVFWGDPLHRRHSPVLCGAGIVEFSDLDFPARENSALLTDQIGGHLAWIAGPLPLKGPGAGDWCLHRDDHRVGGGRRRRQAEDGYGKHGNQHAKNPQLFHLLASVRVMDGKAGPSEKTRSCGSPGGADEGYMNRLKK